ncbi:universal stress protein [Embleya sp. NPDC059259]|uniref:universal stress protein n=1 Tax=unclassified Embleya TaxID=2699296 RepID=UPI00367B3DC0
MSTGIQLPDLGVLVGYDGSPGGERALLWGARAAADAETPLYLVMAVPDAALGGTFVRTRSVKAPVPSWSRRRTAAGRRTPT